MKGSSGSWVATLALFALLAAGGGGHWNPFGSGSGSSGGVGVVGVHGFSLFNWNEWSGSGDSSGGKSVFAAGGGTCAGCTVVVGLLEQLVVIHNTTIDQLLNDVCGLFPSEFASICDYFVDKYGEDVIALIEAKETADAVCNKIELCVDPTCRLFPPPTISQQPSQAHRPSSISRAPPIIISNGLKLGEKETPWDWIKALINKLANDHQPIEDIDDDDFSLAPTLRGWSWKGKDCDDINKDIHPGVAVPKGNAAIDWNCNGINGTDPKTNTPYEELLCGQSGQMGLIVIGDSFGAHFEIPPSYLNASEINGTTYKDLLYVLENEFDWPERSAFTGFEPNSSAIPIDSLYARLRERNLCNHRDYQNVGVNGARSGAVAGGLDKSIARNQTLDFPVLLVYELIGNDVCNPHPDLSRMTTVEEFRANVLQSLQYLDTILPNGSHIVFIGLADGRVLWDNLYNRTHPIGVTYESVYNFLNCLQISPCWVWMNDNETVRDAGSQRAAELSAVYNEIIGNYSFQHFDMAYYDFPFPEIDKVWQSMGGQTWQLIEPVDGFHPNQIAHSLIGGYLWSVLEQEHPSFLGATNPNNAVIQQLFGDQGGY